MTSGEDLFLNLYDDLGAKISTKGPDDIGLEFLVNGPAFENFSRISASFEVFVRCLRNGVETYRLTPGARPEEYVRNLRFEVELPNRLFQNLKFGQRLMLASRVAAEGIRNSQIERDATKDLPPICYLCGDGLRNKKGIGLKPTIEHVWPLSFGGETVGANLLLACGDCNSKRGNIATWAMGPVHSTQYVQSSKDEKNPPQTLKFSLGLARILFAAQPVGKRREPKTLRDASLDVCPAIPKLSLTKDRMYTYFELTEILEVTL